MKNTNEKIHEAFNPVNRVCKENVFTPKQGINDADREQFFDNYDKDLNFSIQQIKQNKLN